MIFFAFKIIAVLVLLWAFLEIACYGGNPNDPHHNRPPWNLM